MWYFETRTLNVNIETLCCQMKPIAQTKELNLNPSSELSLLKTFVQA